MDRFRFRFAACAAALLLTSVAAVAGTKTDFPVFVDSKGMAAFGSIGSTRNTGDTSAYLFCEVMSFNTDRAAVASCNARDSAGVSGTCFTFNPELIAAIRSVKGDSYVEMHWNSSGECTVLRIGNGSDMQPK